MDTVTYPNAEVATWLSQKVICVKANTDQQRDLARSYGVKWTPWLLWLDAEGNQRHANVGWFSPEELLAECAFGCGLVAVYANDWDGAMASFEEILQRWPRSHAAPAALYWTGVAELKGGGGKEAMLQRWKNLRKEHPDSAWAMKVAFIEKNA